MVYSGELVKMDPDFYLPLHQALQKINHAYATNVLSLPASEIITFPPIALLSLSSESSS